MKARFLKAMVVVLAVTSVHLCAFSWARAQVSEHFTARGLELGRELLQAGALLQELGEGQLERAGEPHHISLNGARLKIHTGAIEKSQGQSTSEALADLALRARSHCRKVDAAFEGDAPLLESPVFEWVGAEEAFVYCVRPRENWSIAALSRLFDAFEKSLDLTEWGDFQGAYLRASGDSISVVTVEVAGGFIPSSMFPTQGDAPGVNFPQLPVPRGRRLLSVSHQETVALTVHASDSTTNDSAANDSAANDSAANDWLDQYHKQLAARGFSVKRASHAAGGAHSGESARALVARSQKEAFIVVSKPHPRGSHLTIARLPD
jgi:hypothetical protein